jgi:hypothetical protein
MEQKDSCAYGCLLHVNAIKIKRFTTNIFLCKTMSIQQKNSPKMKFWVFEVEIWYT